MALLPYTHPHAADRMPENGGADARVIDHMPDNKGFDARVLTRMHKRRHMHDIRGLAAGSSEDVTLASSSCESCYHRAAERWIRQLMVNSPS
jgi:hypothetical protein